MSIEARIFVGNLPANVDMTKLRERFAAHGKIIESNPALKGFTFIQYESDKEAKAAVYAENGTEFCGVRLKVSIAKMRDPKKAPPSSSENNDGNRYPDRGGTASWGEEGSGRDPPGGYNHRAGPGSRDNHPRHEGPQGRRSHNGPGGRDAPGVWETLGRAGQSDQPNQRNPQKREEPNDVEIICLMKNTRSYAERIEERLKNMGLNVDVLFPNPDIPLGKVLGNIAMRGVMFGICVAPVNEMHRTLTVNVLQGEQLEHRNMPMDEALPFIAKSFSKIIENPQSSSFKSDHQHQPFGLPPDIKTILGFLMDNRPMSIMEYDKLIKYIVTKRESTLKAEYGTNIPAHLLLPPVGPNQDPVLKGRQEEIQTKVIEILNRKQKLLSQPPPRAAPTLAPSFQEAIDNLVRSGPSLLSSFTAGSDSGGMRGAGSGAGGGGGGGNLKAYYASLYEDQSTSRQAGQSDYDSAMMSRGYNT